MVDLKLKRRGMLKKCGDIFIYMATMLNLKLNVHKNLNIAKLSSKLYNYIIHTYREDDKAF